LSRPTFKHDTVLRAVKDRLDEETLPSVKKKLTEREFSAYGDGGSPHSQAALWRHAPLPSS
jgi:hypothetical protein